jgi:lipoprotein-anchoring transpeptidase ErfK/SrfK
MALAAFQTVSGLPPTGEADEATLRGLLADPRSAFAQAVISPADPAEVDPPPRDWLERSKKRRLLYPSLSNLIAERAHTTERFLAALNPGRDLTALQPGDTILVPATSPERRFAGPLERIEIDLERKAILLFTGKRPVPSGLLFCSIAADPAKAVPGDSRVATVVADPTYTFDPLKWPEVHGIDRKLTIPPGPRSPVGLRWIGLERDGVGMHGAPEPENIGKTGSHGCFRLTNWDAVWLGSLVRIGTPVRILRSAAESSWRWGP